MKKTVPNTRKQLRQFGLMVGLILAGLGLWRLYKGDWETPRVVLWVIGGFLSASGLFAPVLLKPLYTAWMKLAHGLAYVNTRLILTLIYFLMITPIGLLMRLFKGDILSEKFDKKASTYWTEMEPIRSAKEHYERQF